MDEWESLINQYEVPKEPKNLSCTLKTAEVVVGKELAPFELEWIFSTLFKKPIKLLDLIRDKRSDDTWSKVIAEAFKLLANIIHKHPKIEHYYEDIVEVCLLPFSAHTNQQALDCLRSISVQSEVGACHIKRHLRLFEEGTTCKAQLAKLIGTICEHHPSAVSEDVDLIWRVFLNHLDSKKYTVSVINSILHGILGLLKHFGKDLQIREMSEFYDKLVLHLDHCEDVCLQIFQKHIDLFPERIVNDVQIRENLWSRAETSANARAALLSVYTVVCNSVERAQLQNIITKEILPHTKSPRTLVKFTALRALTNAQADCNVSYADLSDYVDLQVLEFDIRNGNVNYNVAEAVFWSLDANIPNSERLLQAALLFYESFPTTKSREIIHKLLKSPKDRRSMAVTFLISESCRSPANCLKVWQQIFDSRMDTDDVVMEYSKLVFEDFVEYIVFALEGYLEDNPVEQLPETITSLLSLTYEVLSLQLTSDSVKETTSILTPVLLEYSKKYASAVPATVLVCDYSGSKDQPDISIDRFESETALTQVCIALTQIENISVYPIDDVLGAFQILLARNDTNPCILSKVIQKLDILESELRNGGVCLGSMYTQLEKLSNTCSMSGRDTRILHRDIIMFLSRNRKVAGAVRDVLEDDILTSKLKSSLVYNLQELNLNVKVNLRGILNLALKDDNSSILIIILKILCENLSIRKDPNLEKCVIKVITRLASHSIDEEMVMNAVMMCDATSAHQMMRYIVAEKSPQTRMILLKAFERILLSADGELLEGIVEQVLMEDYNKSHSEIITVLMELLKENNLLAKKYLPNILLRTLILDVNIFKIAVEIFVNKIELYDEETVSNTTKNIFEAMKNQKSLTKIVSALEYVKTFKSDLSGIFDSFAGSLSILIGVNKVFGLDTNQLDQVRDVFEVIEVDFGKLDTILAFLIEFTDETTIFKSIEILSKIIENVTPASLKDIYKNLSVCIYKINEIDRQQIQKLQTSVENWCKKIPIDEISNHLEERILDDVDMSNVRALKLMLVIFENIFVRPILIKPTVTKWICLVKKMYSSVYFEFLKPKMAYLSDLVEVSLKFMNVEQVKRVLKESTNTGIGFCQTFISAMSEYFIKNMNILLLPDMTNFCILLNDIVRYCVRRPKNGEDILLFVDKLWPSYSIISTFQQKYSLLLDLTVLSNKLGRDSKPMSWVVDAVSSEETKREDRISLIRVLPGGEDYRDLYIKVASELPLKLRELQGHSSTCFRYLLESLAENADEKLLEIVTMFVSGYEGKGWWEEAIDMCMSTLAARGDMDFYKAVYTRTLEDRSASVCTLMMMPLLRYSKAAFCEEFFSTILQNLLTTVEQKPRAISSHYTSLKYLLECTRAFQLLQVIFEKVPKPHIESPNSILYSNVKEKVGSTLFFLPKTVCKLCVELRKSVTAPEGAEPKLVELVRLFQCATYNCLISAVLCCWSDKAAVYGTVLDVTAGRQIASRDVIALPLREEWNQRTTRHAAPLQTTAVEGLSSRTSSLRTHSLRTRAFMRTLSEDPMLYDLKELEPQSEEVQVSDTPLNRHECAATLAAVLRHAAGLPTTDWRDQLATCLDTTCLNAKWLLAQVICNCKEDLKAHASVLQPALLGVVASTAGGLLNGLHIDILDTMIYWNEESPCMDIDVLNSVVRNLIVTIVEMGHRTSLYRSLLTKISVVEKYASRLKIDWSVFEEYFSDTKSLKSKYCLQILKRLLKHKVHIPELLPALFRAIENKWLTPETAELAGLALAVEEEHVDDYLRTFQKVLEKLRKRNEIADYLKLIYYAQGAYPKCCDESNFRMVSDFLPKIVGRDKRKCVVILSSYVTTLNGDHSDDINSLPLMELEVDDASLNLIQNSLHLVSEYNRKQLVMKVAQYCGDAQVKLRLAAYGVLLKALQILLTSESSEPPAKRRPNPTSRIIKAIDTNDKYMKTVLSVCGVGVIDQNKEISAQARSIVGKCLSEDPAVKFCESFVMAVYFPINKHPTTSNTNAIAAMLDLFFTSGVANEGDTMKELLKYSEKNPHAATSLCQELLRLFQTTKRPGFDFNEVIGEAICRTLGDVCGLTPFLVSLARELGFWSISQKPIVEKLLALCKGSEGEHLMKVFNEDFNLRIFGSEQFVLGSISYDDDMEMVPERFSIEDLVTTFGKLSNWEDLTLQDKSKVKTDLPLLWTDANTFKAAIEDYVGGGPVWFEAMVSTYKKTDYEGSLKWFRNIQNWPKKLFAASAVTEVLDWTQMKESGQHSVVDILPSDCLAEWSARVMLRRLYFNNTEVSNREAAVWCKRANELGLHEQASRCCAAITDLYESDTLQWLEQRVIALRALGLERRDKDSLEKALHLTDTFTSQFKESSRMEDVWGMSHQKLLLKQDLNLLEQSHMDDILREVTNQTSTPEGKIVAKQNARVLESLCVLGLTYFDGLWENSDDKTSLLKEMCGVFGLFVDLNLGSKFTLLLDVILNRLDDLDEFNEDLSSLLIKKIKPFILDLDEFSLELVNKYMSRCRWNDSAIQGEVRNVEKFKRCFQLISDAGNSLYKYCEDLSMALDNNDPTQWYQTFAYIKERIFENEYRGLDYQVLSKHKKSLYDISDFDSSDEQTKKQTLSHIKTELRSSKRETLVISQLCPALTQLRTEAEDESLARFLRLPHGLRVVKIEDKVSVFVDAIRRPVVITAKLSNGNIKRCIVKGGERVRVQAAAMRILNAMDLLSPCASHSYYRVTILSEDCGLIEYLEDHERLRSLVSSVQNVDDILMMQKTVDQELILASRSASLQQFETLCAKLPAYTLRSAIEMNAASVQDFISKKGNFLESLSMVTVATYLLGVGDRHLENIMYNTQNGGICHVDWAAVLQYGARELPPARLTRNILAVCDMGVLESRVQKITGVLRNAYKLVLPTFIVSFKWMGDQFYEMFPTIEGILKGTTLSYKVTIDAIRKSGHRYKEKYIELLEEVFQELEEKTVYSVEEQVWSLLRQSTDPRILSVTRSGWEPWI